MNNKIIFILLPLVFFGCVQPNREHLEVEENLYFIEDTIRIKSAKTISLAENNVIIFFNGKIEHYLGTPDNKSKENISAIALSPDEKYFALGGDLSHSNVDTTSISIYKFPSSTPIKIFKAHKAKIHDLAFSSDGKYLVSSSADTSIKIWDLDTLKQTIHFHKAKVSAVKMIKENQTYKLVSVGFDKQVAVHTLDESLKHVTLKNTHKFPYRLMYMAYNEKKKQVAVCGNAKEVTIYDLNLKHIKTIEPKMLPHNPSYNQDGKYLFIRGGKYSSRMNVYNTSDYSRR